MSNFGLVATAFVEMAHSIVWATGATVDRQGRPRSRILHPYWQWDGTTLVGWVATFLTPTKRAHLAHSPYLSITYWAPSHDTCTTECRAALMLDDKTRAWLWQLFENTPPPLGYDPATIVGWSEGPTAPTFAALRLEPWRLRVLPGTLLRGAGGEVLTWSA